MILSAGPQIINTDTYLFRFGRGLGYRPYQAILEEHACHFLELFGVYF